VPDKQRH